MNIIWKDVIEYELNYEVNNLGQIRNKKTGLMIKPLNNGHNYFSVPLCLNGVKKRLYVHRVVASSFLPNPELKKEVNHIDGDRSNNALSNLEWVTRSENHFHRYKVLNQKGVNFGKTGEKNWNSKKVGCFDENMNLIKEYYGVMEAARQIGVNEASIRSAIYSSGKLKGFKWKYL